jgi:hypothetical protein
MIFFLSVLSFLCNIFYFDSLKKDKILKICITNHLVSKLNKYDIGKGKAYSYFTVIARNFIINENKKQYDKKKQKIDNQGLDNIEYNSTK